MLQLKNNNVINLARIKEMLIGIYTCFFYTYTYSMVFYLYERHELISFEVCVYIIKALEVIIGFFFLLYVLVHDRIQ